MKKFFIYLVFFINTFSYCITTYDIEPNEVLSITYSVADEIFEKNIDGWKYVLVGTLSAETNLGQFKGSSKNGIAQMEKQAFEYIHSKLEKSEDEQKKIEKHTGVDFSDITFETLSENNYISIMYMAYFYKFVCYEKENPQTKEDAAKIWKEYYNTRHGKGSVEKFLTVYENQEEYIEKYEKNNESVWSRIKNFLKSFLEKIIGN